MTTIHCLLLLWGAIDRSRKAPTQSKRRVDGRSAALRCVGRVEGLLCGDALWTSRGGSRSSDRERRSSSAPGNVPSTAGTPAAMNARASSRVPSLLEPFRSVVDADQPCPRQWLRRDVAAQYISPECRRPGSSDEQQTRDRNGRHVGLCRADEMCTIERVGASADESRSRRRRSGQQCRPARTRRLWPWPAAIAASPGAADDQRCGDVTSRGTSGRAGWRRDATLGAVETAICSTRNRRLRRIPESGEAGTQRKRASGRSTAVMLWPGAAHTGRRISL